jgi:acetyl esterase/lipase
MLKGIVLSLLVLKGFSCQAQLVIPLYKGNAPGALPVDDRETMNKSATGNGRSFLVNVTRPTLTIFMPKKMNAARTAVIICPGGGYNRLSIEDGGYEAAKQLADSGIVGIVLKYRLWRDSVYSDFKTVPVQDMEQAMELVYKYAEEWNLDTAHIGLLGFSAGGHLAAMAATGSVKRKPAFTLLIYPVISFLDSLTSRTSNSRNNLLGKKISAAEKINYSPELHISKTTPPAFIVHAEDDSTSLVGNSLAYYKGLVENKVMAQLLLYQKGGHGFALYNKAQDEFWMPAALKWLTLNGFYKR